MARTNIELDDTLLKQAKRLSQLTTKKEIVHQALKNFVKSKKRKLILNLEGKIHWEGNLARMRQARKWS